MYKKKNFLKYAVTKKLSIKQAERPWEKHQVGNFVAKNTLDIFHVQTSHKKTLTGFPILATQWL
jgi:hypothetical protein